MRLVLTCVFLLLFFFPNFVKAQSQQTAEFNTAMFESTFAITDNKTFGTAFILLRPDKQNPEKGYYVLITANHVLNGMQKEAVVLLRRKVKENDFEIFSLKLFVRDDKGNPLWKTFGDSDVAVMYIAIPEQFKPSAIISTSLLATDEAMKTYGIHPGDELQALGYPYRQSSPVFYPILRSGKIASYPLLPSKDVKTYYLDFEVYSGNSGGPVYLSQNPRAYGNGLTIGNVNLITGLVSQQLKEPLTETPIKIAVIVPSQFIIDAINQLPDKPVN